MNDFDEQLRTGKVHVSRDGEIFVNGQQVGSVERYRERTSVTTSDRGMHYVIGHTEATRWRAQGAGPARSVHVTGRRSRKDAVETLLGRLEGQGYF